MALTDAQLRAFVPENRFLKSPYTAPVPVEEETEVTTSYGIPNTNAFINSGDGGGGGGGFGLFGNLDESTEKTFHKDVWDGTGWVNTPVKGYLTPSGWKTYEGKNINHAGIEFPTIAGLLLDKNFGKGPQPGDIKGTFTDGWDSGIDKIKEGWEDEKEKWSGILGIDKAKAFFKAKKDKEITVGPEYQTTDITQTDTKGGGEFADDSHGDDWQKTFSGGAAGGEFDGTPQPPGGQQGHNEGMAESSPDPVSDAGGDAEWGEWSKGGRVGFFAHGGRVYLNLGGLARLL